MKKILAIIGVVIVILAVGLAGTLDHDEYIEANSAPVTRMPLYYE